MTLYIIVNMLMARMVKKAVKLRDKYRMKTVYLKDLENYVSVKQIDNVWHLNINFDTPVHLMFNLNKSSVVDRFIVPLLENISLVDKENLKCFVAIKSEHSIGCGNILEHIDYLKCEELKGATLQIKKIVANCINASELKSDIIYSDCIRADTINCKMLYCTTLQNSELTVTRQASITRMENCKIISIKKLALAPFCLDNKNMLIAANDGLRAKYKKYVAIDIETSGIESDNDIISLNAVYVEYGKVVDKFSSFVNIAKPLRDVVVEITGITNEMLATAPPIQEVLTEFSNFVAGKQIVSYNLDFDKMFLDKYKHITSLFNYKLPPIDLLAIIKYLLPNTKPSIPNILEKFSLEQSENDSENIYKIFEALKYNLQELYLTAMPSELIEKLITITSNRSFNT